MGDGVDSVKVVREGAASYLVIVIRITPSTEPARRATIEYCCIDKVGAGIYEKERNISIAEDPLCRGRAK